MNAITCLNPHATLILCREKKWETRSWRPQRTKLSSPIALSSSARYPKDCQQLAEMEPFKRCLFRHGYGRPEKMHHGEIICLLTIGEIITTNEWLRRYCKTSKLEKYEKEYLFGDYGPRRWAWKIEQVHILWKPVPVKGNRMMWTVPLEIEEQVEAQLE